MPSALAQKSLAALTGGQTDATPTPSPILSFSVKGASGATVEVRNLVPGTTAEDVAVSIIALSIKFCDLDFP